MTCEGCDKEGPTYGSFVLTAEFGLFGTSQKPDGAMHHYCIDCIKKMAANLGIDLGIETAQDPLKHFLEESQS